MRNQIVSHDEWLRARLELLATEKELTRQRDTLTRRRMAMPWERVEKSYHFEAPSGTVSLAELFEGRSQLIVYHFMFAPEWAEGCKSCSFWADNFNGITVHLDDRDATLAAISRAPLAKIEAYKKRMGWKFNWVSSLENDFNRDYGVSFTKDDLARQDCYNFGTSGFPSEEAPGISVFGKKGKDVFHTYSTYARGSENVLNTYNYLDLVPKGRDEDAFYFPMAWVRHHDRYEDGRLADAAKPYWPPETTASTQTT